MKYLIMAIVVFSLSACAHVSEYNQGCRDGVEGLQPNTDKSFVNKYCDELDFARGSSGHPKASK